jgi:hypothetical protein
VDPSIKPRSTVTLELDILVQAVHLQVRAAKSVWLRWDMGKIFACFQDTTDGRRFSMRSDPQTVGAYFSLRRTKQPDAAVVRLPVLTIVGEHQISEGQAILTANLNLGFSTGLLKPAVLDRLLSLHQKLGADIAEFVQEYKDGAQRNHSHDSVAGSTENAASGPSSPPKHLVINVKFSIAGIRFGLRADDVASTLMFEALALQGHVTNKDTKDLALLWRAKVDHFGLSLGHLDSSTITDDLQPIRKHRSAYMVLDIDIQEVPSTDTSPARLNVGLKNIHTVMHIAALSELTDLVKSWQSDIHLLNDSRAAEVAEVKTTTSKLLKRLDTGEKAIQPELSWFANRVFKVEVNGLGIAVPLDDSAAIDMQHREHSSTPAMLFSIRTISFHNRKNETARFRVQQMAIQFRES